MSLSDSSSERSFNSEDSEANLAEVEDEQSDRESQVSCESLENDIAYANEPLADEEWLMEKKKKINKSCKTQLTTQRTRHYGSSQTPTYSGNVVRQENKFD